MKSEFEEIAQRALASDIEIAGVRTGLYLGIGGTGPGCFQTAPTLGPYTDNCFYCEFVAST